MSVYHIYHMKYPVILTKISKICVSENGWSGAK